MKSRSIIQRCLAIFTRAFSEVLARYAVDSQYFCGFRILPSNSHSIKSTFFGMWRRTLVIAIGQGAHARRQSESKVPFTALAPTDVHPRPGRATRKLTACAETGRWSALRCSRLGGAPRPGFGGGVSKGCRPLLNGC